MAQNENRRQFGRVALKSTSLARTLSQMRKRYMEEGEPEELAVPYVLTCAACLESKLNDSLLFSARKRYGDDVAEALMWLSLPAKLNVVVPLMTQGQYRINKEHFVYRSLSSLIRTRNRLTHAKSQLEVIDASPEELVSIPTLTSGSCEIPREFWEDRNPSLAMSEGLTPTEFHDALEKLNKWFFRRSPDRLSRVEMVIDRSKDNDWEEVVAVMVREPR